jgi:hypothetical protein
LADLRGSVWQRSCGSEGWELGDQGPSGAEEQAQESEIPWLVEQWLCGPTGRGLECSASYSFSIWWCGEAVHELGVQSADVSALPCALPQPSVSPASQQSPWFRELRRSAAVSQSPSWISQLILSPILSCKYCLKFTFTLNTFYSLFLKSYSL